MKTLRTKFNATPQVALSARSGTRRSRTGLTVPMKFRGSSLSRQRASRSRPELVAISKKRATARRQSPNYLLAVAPDQ